MTKYNIHIVVICCNEERKTFQKQQFHALKLPYDVTYAHAYSPESSKSYIVDYDPEYPEPDTTLCCMRSHAAVLSWFYHNTTSDYVLVVEDDVTFRTDDLVNKIDRVIDLWSKHSTEIDYVSLGYLINNTPDGSYPDAAHNDDVLRWGKQMPSVWGTQAYLVERSVVKQMIDVFYQPNTRDLRKKIEDTIRLRDKYTNRHERIQSDSLLAILFRQGFVVPMLAIEMPFQSIIETTYMGDIRWTKAIEKGTIVLSDFYGCS
jgi:GR25 family glycosyltransferase involved in LPS biosynthesis